MIDSDMNSIVDYVVVTDTDDENSRTDTIIDV